MEGIGSSGHARLGDVRRWKTQPASASRVDPGPEPEGGLLGFLAVSTRAAEKAVAEPAWAVDEPGLAAGMALIGELRSLVARVELALTSEVLTRGTAEVSGLSAVDWLVDQQGSTAPRPDARAVASVVRVAEAATHREPGGTTILTRVQSGALPLRSGAALARFVRDVEAIADPELLEADVEILCSAASDGPDGRGLTDRELARAIRYARELMRSDRGLEADEDRCRDARAFWSGPGPAGMTSYRMLLDPEGAAVVDAAVNGLSRPAPGPDGEPDLRPAARRRADALVEIVRRGVASGSALPGGVKTHVVVTIPLADLEERLQGAGLTTAGEVLSPATVRRMACDSRLIPMVLGGDGEVLDLGRSARLFSPAQRRAVAHRDGHCTYPACTRDASWCDVHHLSWWSRGGPTDLDNAALLCERHHSLVHRRDLVGTAGPDGVSWSARPP